MTNVTDLNHLADNRRKPKLVSMIIETNADGYLARIPGIQGAFAEGDSPQEAMFNCIDVLQMIIDYKQEQNQTLKLGEIEVNSNTQFTVAIPVSL
ncbi:MAG: type II toxin-antitoxin system HicB family antitoxin [Sphaerospermopsis kisseleviana]|jgi:predicted RNase H-like HicB family nuclease|uniref:type II toxin-antitoxin system HicB family antitoxin n=1 Tax=Anabaena sp. CS-542/02 TaxID=3021719 RepID=UPI00232EB4A0|nr:hypothetical protein [Anabaena sp. CS-542/02]MDB9447102.1 hypothetical protein [Anabaena sp. CS-542/02]